MTFREGDWRLLALRSEEEFVDRMSAREFLSVVDEWGMAPAPGLLAKALAEAEASLIEEMHRW